MSEENLSPQAARIKELVDGGMTIKVVLQQHPDLVEALDEYVANERNEAHIEGRPDTQSAPVHSIVEQVKKATERKG